MAVVMPEGPAPTTNTWQESSKGGWKGEADRLEAAQGSGIRVLISIPSCRVMYSSGAARHEHCALGTLAVGTKSLEAHRPLCAGKGADAAEQG